MRQNLPINLLLAIIPFLGILAALSLAPLFIVLVLVSLLSLLKVKLSTFLAFKPITFNVIAFLLLAGLSSINSLHPSKSLIATSLLVVTVIFGCYILLITKDIKDFNHNIFIFSYSCTLALCTFEYFSNGYIIRLVNYHLLHKNVYFTMDYLNRGMAFISITIWILVSHFHKIGNKLLSYIYLLLVTTLILLSSSESAKLGLIAGILVFTLAQLLPKYIARVLQFAIYLAAITFPIFVYNLIYNPALEFLVDQLPWTFIHRLHIWQNTINLISLKPFLGWGFNASRIIADLNLADFTHHDLVISFLPLHPHNLVLQLLLELGLVGLFIYLGIWVASISAISQSNFISSTKSGLYACLSSYLVVSQSSFNIWMSWWLSAIFICLFIFLIFTQVKPNS